MAFGTDSKIEKPIKSTIEENKRIITKKRKLRFKWLYQ